jgi:hypothetical protein
MSISIRSTFTDPRQPGDIVKILEDLDLRKKEEDEAFQKVSGPAIPTKLSNDEMEVVSAHTDHTLSTRH